MKWFTIICCSLLFFPPPSPTKTFVFCSEGNPEGFSPVIGQTGTTMDAAAKTIYNRLLDFEPGTTNIVPSLAVSWTIINNREYIFKLRTGVHFHSQPYFEPTRPMNADDVIFSLTRPLDPNHPFHNINVGSNKYIYFDSLNMNSLISKMVKINDHTIMMKLSRPETPLLSNLAMHFSSIYSKEYADQLLANGTPELLDTQPVGTGPFQLVEYQKDHHISYKAHQRYWKGKASIDKLVFSITPNATVRFKKLNRGECHVMPYPHPGDLETIAASQNIEVLEKPALNVSYMAYNTREAPFDDVRVRLALNMAINKKDIVKYVFKGGGMIAKNPIPPLLWSYNELTKDDPYDPIKARRILKEAGYNKKIKTTLWAIPVQRPYNPDGMLMAELIKSDWAKIGVEAEIISPPWDEYLTLARKVDRKGVVLLGWSSDNGDPDNFLATLLGCDAVSQTNLAQWCYQPYDDLVQQAKSEVVKSKRIELYKKAQLIFKEQAPWATIAHYNIIQPVRKEVRNFVVDPLSGHQFYGVDLISRRNY